MASEECVVNILDLFTRSKFGTRINDFQQTVEAWMLVLHPLDDGVVMEAAVTLARNDSDFVPSAGAVFQAALDLLDTEPGGDEAWTQVLKYSKSASLRENNPVKISARVAEALRLMGGNCGDWLVDDLPFRRWEFLDVYGRLEKTWRDQVAALPAPEGRRMLTHGN